MSGACAKAGSPWAGLVRRSSAFAAQHLKLAVFALALYTPFEPFVLNFVPRALFLPARFGFYLVIALGCVLIVLRRAAEGKRPWPKTRLDAPLACLLGLAIASAVIAGADVFCAAASLQALLRFVVVGYFAALLMDWTLEDLWRLTEALVLIAAGQALIGLVQSWAGAGASRFLAPRGCALDGVVIGDFTQHLYTSGFQVFATLGRYNVLAMFLVFFGLLHLPAAVSKDRGKGLEWGGYLLGAVCVFLTAARGPWLGLAVGLWALAALRRHWLAWVLPLAGFLALGGLYAVLHEQVRYVGTADAAPLERALEVFSPQYFEVHTQNYGRLYFLFLFPFALWQEGLVPFLFGIGPGMVGGRALGWLGEHALAPFGMTPEQAMQIDDSTWPYMLAQLGLLGLLAFLWLLGRVFVEVWRIWQKTNDPGLRRLALGWLAAAAAMAVAATFTTVFEIRPLGLYFWLYAGALVRFGGAGEFGREPGSRA